MTALEGFASLGAVAEVALVSLDRAFLFLEEGCAPAEVHTLGDETYQMMERLAADPQLLSALVWWRNAEDYSLERLKETQARILELAPATAPVASGRE